MSEHPSPHYTRLSHPHTGDPRVDPEARVRKEQKKTPKVTVPNRRRKLTGQVPEAGFFDESLLVSPNLTQKLDLSGKLTHLNKLGHSPNPEVPVTYKWVVGEFHTAPWGADASPFAGRSKGRVRVVSMGKKLNKEWHNGVLSFYGTIIEVRNSKDRPYLGQSGWWRIDDFSKEGRSKKRATKPAPTRDK